MKSLGREGGEVGACFTLLTQSICDKARLSMPHCWKSHVAAQL